MSRRYTEKDLSFYTEIENKRVTVDVTSKGRVVSWAPLDDIEGYAIYKGSGRTFNVTPMRYIKIVILSTHNKVYNSNGSYPTRKNVAISEIEVYVNDGQTDYTNTLPMSSFTASSDYDSTTSIAGAFNNVEWEDKYKGWQSAKINPDASFRDSLREWIRIDLGAKLKIDKIRIQNGVDSLGLCGIYEYRIDVSEDGLYWTTLNHGTLERDNAFQDIDLKGYFYTELPADEDWELLETVGTATLSYVDSDSSIPAIDYRVTGIVVGDISFEALDSETADLKITGDFESIRQDMTNRIRSQKGQWKRHERLGSNLELIEGMPNTKATADYGENLIIDSLVNDNRVHINDLKVRAVPKSITQVDYYVIVTSSESEDPILVVENMNM